MSASTEITLAKVNLPDGCWTVDTATVIAAAVACARSPKERQGFPRFQLRVDGSLFHTDRKEMLAKWIECCAAGAKCRVFRNAGKGATIDFSTSK